MVWADAQITKVVVQDARGRVPDFCLGDRTGLHVLAVEVSVRCGSLARRNNVGAFIPGISTPGIFERRTDRAFHRSGNGGPLIADGVTRYFSTTTTEQKPSWFCSVPILKQILRRFTLKADESPPFLAAGLSSSGSVGANQIRNRSSAVYFCGASDFVSSMSSLAVSWA